MLSFCGDKHKKRQGAPSASVGIAEVAISIMPPSIASENLQRDPSIESIHSSSHPSQSTMNAVAKDDLDTFSRTLPQQAADFSHYRDYHIDSDEDDGCGDLSLLERPSWSQSLLRLKWCCPGAPGLPSKDGTFDHRIRTRSESTESSCSQQMSPVPVAPPPFQWEGSPHMSYPQHAWYPSPPGYAPPPYAPNGYAAWGYPPAPMPYALPHQQQMQGVPMPPPQLFHNKSNGYAFEQSTMQHQKLTSPEPYLAQYDSGTESEASRKSSGRRIATPKQRRTPKPPLVQRRATAPVQSSSNSQMK